MGAEQILEKLRQAGEYLVVAESVTGGALTAAFTAIPGASDVLLAGVVAYDTELKHKLLGVSATLLAQQGPVTEEVAIQMALGLREKVSALKGIPLRRITGVATTGVAGPTEQAGHPVGEVFIAVSRVAQSGEGANVYQHQISGDRAAVQKTAVSLTLSHLLEEIRG